MLLTDPTNFQKKIENLFHKNCQFMIQKLFVIFSLAVFSLHSSFAQDNNYKSGKKDGIWNYYSGNKTLLARHFYKEGVRVGIWEFYTLKGVLSWTYNFNTSAATYLLENTQDGYYAYQGNDGTWIKQQPDRKTLFLSSDDQWKDFLVNHLKFPESAAQTRIQGKVQIRVYVDEQGKAVKYEIGNHLDPLLEKEALRVTKLYDPEFVPAEQNKKNLKSIYILKVSFLLADSQ
jgi:hypothetical protein